MAKKRPARNSENPSVLFYLVLLGMAVWLVYRLRFAIWANRYTIASIAIVCLALVLLWRLRKRRLAAHLSEIDRMGGHEFERFLVRLFRKYGYTARHIGADGNDFGADLIIEKAGIKIAVQAKNYTAGRVGNDAVQQAIAGATYYDCDQAMVVTNARYTKAAHAQANGCRHFPVTLWDRDEIAALIKR